MQLSEFKKRADYFTGKASELNRQLLLGGIAIIWLFKDPGNGLQFQRFLLYPLLALSLGLLLDLLHYVIAGHIWRKFYKQQEGLHKGKSADGGTEWYDVNLKAPRKLNVPVRIFYYAKIVLMVCAYLLLIYFIIDKITLA